MWAVIRFFAAVTLCSGLALSAAADGGQRGVKLVGRWMPPANAPTATYGGSLVLLKFKQSSGVSADLTVVDSIGEQALFISVSVDGGKATRIGLTRGRHSDVELVSGLSQGPHLVALRKEGEPHFGALQFSNPKLDLAGRWLDITDDRPIVEVIGDSDATGICALGPDSPATAQSIYTSSWASQAASWVGLLEAGLAGVGHPVDMVDLGISGSKTGSENVTYDLTAPGYSDAKFDEYSAPGRKHASLVLMWGGANDRHAGGDMAGSGTLSYATLSTFQKGVYDQLAKIFERNPGVKVVLLDYIDPTIPDWRPAYAQVENLLSADQRKQIFSLAVYDPKGKSDACEVDPKGHPNLSMHATWAAQILVWMMSKDIFPRLDFPMGEQWYDD